MEALIAHGGARSGSTIFTPAPPRTPIARSAGASSSAPGGRLEAVAEEPPPPVAAPRPSRRPRRAAVPSGQARRWLANGVTWPTGRARIAASSGLTGSTLSTPSLPQEPARSAFPEWRSRMPGRSTWSACANAISTSSPRTGVLSRSAPITSPAATAARSTGRKPPPRCRTMADPLPIVFEFARRPSAASFPRRRESIYRAGTSSYMGPRLRGDDAAAKITPENR